MTVYAESSAVLAWLLEESTADEVRRGLAGARTVVASDLTVVECRRALIRLRTRGQLSRSAAAKLGDVLERAASHWTLLSIDREVTALAGRELPGEPLPTLDALHLASALVLRGQVPDLAFLALDQRLRDAAEAAGLRLVPDGRDPDLVAEPGRGGGLGARRR